MVKQKTAIVAGVSFQAATVADARAIGEKQIAKFVREAGIGPSTYRVHAMHVVVWPILDGWAYSLLLDSEKDGVARAVCTMGGTRLQACVAAIGHAAQYQWQWTHDIVDDDAFYGAAIAVLARDSDSSEAQHRLRELLGYAAWQRRHRAARDAGAEPCVAHDIATRTRSIADAERMARDTDSSVWRA